MNEEIVPDLGVGKADRISYGRQAMTPTSWESNLVLIRTFTL
jgi:hypothetical protein